MTLLQAVRRVARRRVTKTLFEVHLSDRRTGQPLPWTVQKLSDWHRWEAVPVPSPCLFGADELAGMRGFLETVNGTAMAPNGVVVTLVGHPAFA